MPRSCMLAIEPRLSERAGFLTWRGLYRSQPRQASAAVAPYPLSDWAAAYIGRSLDRLFRLVRAFLAAHLPRVLEELSLRPGKMPVHACMAAMPLKALC